MKRKVKIIPIAFLLLSNLGVSEQNTPEKEIKTKINEVTVYLEGAQITRRKNIEIQPGRSTLKFVALSPYVDAKSINVKAAGEITVLSVNHQLNYMALQKASERSEELTEIKDVLVKRKEKEQANLEILEEELNFLKSNKSIGGANTGTNIDELKEAASYYSERIKTIKLKEIEINNNIKDINEELEKINNQIKGALEIEELPTGEILVNIEAKRNTSAELEVKYLVGNAGWFPSYDLRAKNIEQPINLVYKANLHQNTNVDWDNVKLTFSSSDPNTTGNAPELKTYFLGYNTPPPSYVYDVGQVHGIVYAEEDKEPLPGVSIMVKGTTIGTVSDMNGNYSLTLPPNAETLIYSFVGMQTEALPITSSMMNVQLKADAFGLDEVVVMGYAPSASPGAASGIRIRGVSTTPFQRSRPEEKKTTSIPVQTTQLENQTTVEFSIKEPYSIPSNGKNFTIEMEYYSLPTEYEYLSIPKIDNDAFLLANIADWEKYNLLEGEANVFFEDTYTGKTLIDARYISDTLTISLGRDKSVVVNRSIQKQFTSKKFLASKKEETRSWLISVKNNKPQKINMVILDQIPVSTIENIEVDAQKLSGAKLNEETGEVKWVFELEPTEQKEWELRYVVTYPKYGNLIVE